MSGINDWRERSSKRHAQEVAAGLHDDQCEYGPRLVKFADGHTGESYLHMCHCSKRRRIANGWTEPPGPLEYQYPLCPRCDNKVSHDGDGFVCDTCRVTWSSANMGDVGTFTDDYGDLGEPLGGAS